MQSRRWSTPPSPRYRSRLRRSALAHTSTLRAGDTRLCCPERAGCWLGGLLQKLADLRADRLSPDVVALRLRVQVVRAEGIRQERALLVEELRADVQEEH